MIAFPIFPIEKQPTMIYFKKIALLLFLSILVSCGEQIETATEKPNIIYIMADDHTTQGFGIYGSRLASLNPTPTLDKIANEGMIFDNCFVSNSICTPSRAAVITEIGRAHV